MAKRFEQLFELPNNMYSMGSPIIVVAGALLKDTKTGSVIVQLKYQSVSSATIKALRIDITAYDVMGHIIQGKPDYQYLDLSVQGGETFGSNKAIVLPDANTRSFAINSLSVVFEDGSAISAQLPMSVLPKATSLEQTFSSTELVTQYKIATNEKAIAAPCESLGLWMCSCGEWNNSQRCTHCGLTREVVFSSHDISSLTAAMKERLAVEENLKIEKAKLNAEVEKKKKSRNKIIAISISVVAIVSLAASVFSAWLYPDLIKPRMMYNQAQALLSDEDFDEAISIFKSLGHYKDSADKLSYAYFQKAIHLKNVGNFEDAISFMELSGCTTKDIEYLELQYSLANEFFSASRYDDAKSIYKSISSYENSTELALRCDYQKGCQYFESGQYLDAVAVFSELTGYLDVEDKIKSANSLYYLDQGSILYNEAKFHLAMECLQNSYESEATELIFKAEKEIEYINSICGIYYLKERASQGRPAEDVSSTKDFCKVSFDFENGQFVFNNNGVARELRVTYSFDKQEKYHNESKFIESKYYYQFIDGRLFMSRYRGYEYYEKN